VSLIRPFILAALLLLPALPARAEPSASQHQLVLDPAYLSWQRSIFQNHGWEQDLDDCPPYGGGPWPVGFQHEVDTFWFGDSYENCVFETALRFDLSKLHQYSGAVLIRARLTYTDAVFQLRDGDGSLVGDPQQVQHDATWDSCTAQAAVPNTDWRGQKGILPYTVDPEVQRLDRTTWDVTNQAQRWYYQSDDQNTGLVLLGYDEGTDFSNNASCISGLDNFKLTLDFVSNDPTATPTPTFLQHVGDSGRAASNSLPTPTATLPAVHRSDGLGFILGTPTPLPDKNGSVSKVLPDLLITGVATNGIDNTHGVEPICQAGQPITFTVHVKNAGVVDAGDSSVVALAVDGVPKATSTVDRLPVGAEATATIGGIVLDAGFHGYVVSVNDGHKIMESDFDNNSFSFYPILCVT
jgi:uncharacterized repeat protein (TIGR01451 family)